MPPTTTVGELIVRTGVGTIENGKDDDVPPPGAGEKTVTCAVPRDARSLEGIVARTCPEVMNVVGRSEPFHRTTDDETKLLPLTERVNDGMPMAAALGDREPATGTGFDAAVTVTVGLVAARV